MNKVFKNKTLVYEEVKTNNEALSYDLVISTNNPTKVKKGYYGQKDGSNIFYDIDLTGGSGSGDTIEQSNYSYVSVNAESEATINTIPAFKKTGNEVKFDGLETNSLIQAQSLKAVIDTQKAVNDYKANIDLSNVSINTPTDTNIIVSGTKTINLVDSTQSLQQTSIGASLIASVDKNGDRLIDIDASDLNNKKANLNKTILQIEADASGNAIATRDFVKYESAFFKNLLTAPQSIKTSANVSLPLQNIITGFAITIVKLVVQYKETPTSSPLNVDFNIYLDLSNESTHFLILNTTGAGLQLVLTEINLDGNNLNLIVAKNWIPAEPTTDYTLDIVKCYFNYDYIPTTNKVKKLKK